jgi:hypothetical protein
MIAALLVVPGSQLLPPCAFNAHPAIGIVGCVMHMRNMSPHQHKSDCACIVCSMKNTFVKELCPRFPLKDYTSAVQHCGTVLLMQPCLG